MDDNRLALACAPADYVSAAFQQNAIPIIQEISITNSSDLDATDVEIEIATEPAFSIPYVVRADRIGAGKTQVLPVIDLRLDAAFLRLLTEAVAAEFVLTLKAVGQEPVTTRIPTRVLAPSHWGGSRAAPELVAAFVRPNEPSIDVILHDASVRLARAGKESGLSGYKSSGRERAWDIAGAIWAAIAAHGITYALPPASFEQSGQKVRSPSYILDRKVATCFDLSLFYASVLEQAGLNPLVVLTRGHAFVGIWLKPEEFSSAVIDDMQTLRKRRDMEDLIFVETTALTSIPPARFRDAVGIARRHVDEEASEALEVAIDVRRARIMGISPLDLGEATAARPVSTEEAVPVDLELDDAPAFVDDQVVEEEPDDGPVDRLERWKRKLLDLTLRNKLLNFKEGKKSVLLDCPDPARLEDLLSAGAKFKLLPKSDVLAAGDQRDAALYREQHQTDGRAAFLKSALEQKQLHTTLTDRELDDRLTELYRLTQTAFEEGGANVLFLAFGFLKWTVKEGAQPYHAPLLLVPVGLQRSSVRAGFQLVTHEDEARFNPTLLEMLRQDFHLKMPELERDLPTDSSGLDLSRIWQIVRSHVRDLKGWEVSNRVILSAFSFTKFLMWRELVDRMEILKQNPIVRHLVDSPKETYGEGQEGFPKPERIDDDYHPSQLFAPLSADSSQLAAVLAASEGKDFVLFGPPGTGKSQTIANMISQCLALGKTVLFVSQKTAALSVVQDRLKRIGLGDYCLEVHSAKAQKSAVLAQLKSSWHERAAPTAADWQAANSELAKLRDELNTLVRTLHRQHANGLTAYDAFGLVVGSRDRFADLELQFAEEPSRERLAELREICRDLALLSRDLGHPAEHALNGIRRTEWSHTWRSDVERTIQAALAALTATDTAVVAFAEVIGLEVGLSWRAIYWLARIADFIGTAEGRQSVPLIEGNAQALANAVTELETLQERLQRQTSSLTGRYRQSVYDLNLPGLLADWTEACASNMLFRGSRQKKVRLSLQPFAAVPLPDDIGPEIAALIDVSGTVRSIQALGNQLTVFGAGWNGTETDAAHLKARLAWVDKARQLSANIAPRLGLDPAHLLAKITSIEVADPHRLSDGGDIRRAQKGLQAAVGTLGLRMNELSALTGSTDADLPPYGEESWATACAAVLRRWLSGLNDAPRWCRWQHALVTASAAGLDPVVAAISAGTVQPAEIVRAFDVAHARWWSRHFVDRDPILRRFLAIQHEDAIERFRAADERIGELAKRIVGAKLSGTVPPPTAFGKDQEWGTLSRELIKKQRHLPLRQLFSALPTALTRLTPCVMMSPLSIAQYLPPDSKPFDVVIFDEASQIPVWDAIGAMARGRQVVVAGDPEQLPPTSVGDRGVDDNEDGTDVEDQESILSECIASNIPPRRLDWHYRSKHESLIAFSNSRYYGGRLVTFPSPVTDDRAVRYVHVPGGVYERGAGRVNREEARVVVADLIGRLRNPRFAAEGRSIGVVTFNGEQQRLIENLIDAERRSDPSLETYFDPARWHEPVFVKNLENVQGDERDTILFSVAVAPDGSGRPVSTISSLNKDGGYRRLNVAITRARREMVVFATLRPDDIDLGRTRARGVRDFKHFLEFAERGPRAFAEAAAPGSGTDSPFEDAVKACLEAKGWMVHTQIGVSGFRVDLGVVHPDAPGRYLAGVECDGATYHRSATARDRDRLRERVLTDLGWRIRRVWSTEWWQDADRAFVKLNDRLLADLEADRAEAERKAAEAAVVAEAQRLAAEAAAAKEAERAEPAPTSDDAASEAPSADLSGGPEVGIDAAKESNVVALPARLQHEAGHAAAVAAITPESDAKDGGQLREPPASEVVIAREPVRQYARPTTSDELASPVGRGASYQVADVEGSGCEPNPELFYDAVHRNRIRAMTAHVIAVEGPIYEDLLVHRIARAHGFQRSAGKIREIVLGAVDKLHPRTEDDERVLLWPKGADVTASVAFRLASVEVRDHSDIPLIELRSLGHEFLAEGADQEEAVRRMAAEFGLGKLREKTRARFEKALGL